MNTLDELIVALCRDFERRKKAIAEKSYGARTLMEYRYINFRMLEAVAELAGEDDAECFINEIGSKTGYAKSELYRLSEATYKRRKSEAKRAIALKLHLVD